jgi:hypothetical protein
MPPETTPDLGLVEVANLSPRASVALAIRCALRTVPHFRLPDNDDAGWQTTYDAALQRASDFAMGGEDAGEGLEELVRIAYQMAEDSAEMTQYSGYSAAHAVQIVAHALAASRSPGGHGMEMLGSTYGACRVLISKCQTLGRETVLTTLRADLAALRAMPRQTGFGAPVNPGTGGPLGELWPFGAPPEI